MWITLIAIGVALLIDLLIYLGNQPEGQVKKPYHPNLKIWGLGFIAGLGMFVATLIEQAIQSLIWSPPVGGSSWLILAPLLFLTAALGFLAWGVVALCQPE
jgi:hypothetical protein